MKPPICSICGKDFRSEMQSGGGIQFKATESDYHYNKRMKETGMTGHPAGYHWFCHKHLKYAEPHKQLTFKEAYPLIIKDCSIWIKLRKLLGM